MLINKLDMQKNPKIAVTGSVLMKNDIVYEAFENRLKDSYPNGSFIRKDISNTIGGYYYYKKMIY